MENRILRAMSIAFFVGIAAGCVDDEPSGSDCTPGMEACECVNGQFCTGNLECHSGICIDLGNADDEMNSDDTTGNGDGDGDQGDGDPDSGDGDGDTGDECIQTYNACYDFDTETLTGECCPGMICVTAEADVLSGCVPECVTHSECTTDCCVTVNNGMNYCSPATSICNDFGKCIDTCAYSNDAVCDDGGPDSEFSLCEYGTDCSDCGPRF
jgi:hypothetical protein